MIAAFWRLEEHDTLPSTSDLCRRRAEAGEAAGLALLAHRQTAGRGTNGHTWSSPPGNLALSLLLRPNLALADIPAIAPRTGQIVAAALAPHAPAPLSVKFPNDILLNGAKLAGILVESAATGSRLDWLIIGIGANLAHAPDLPDRATACLGEALSPRSAAEAILTEMEKEGVFFL